MADNEERSSSFIDIDINIEEGEIEFDSDVMEVEIKSETITLNSQSENESKDVVQKKPKKQPVRSKKRPRRKCRKSPLNEDKEQQFFVETSNISSNNVTDEIDEIEGTWIRGASPTMLMYNCNVILEDIFSQEKNDDDDDRKSITKKHDEDDDHRKPFKKKRRHRHSTYTLTTPTISPATNKTPLPQLQTQVQQVCKFYVQGCCMKENNCNYMHGEFPCKFYYLGIEHPTNDSENTCKFLHGPPIESVQLRVTLITHISTAPFNILGDFPKFALHEITEKFDAQHLVLMKKFGRMPINDLTMSESSDIPTKRTRWSPVEIPIIVTEDDDNNQNLNELRDILVSKKISQLKSKGIECVEQLFDMTLIQLTEIGLSFLEIHELQEKIVAKREKEQNNSSSNDVSTAVLGDIDMRQKSCLDIDMRLLQTFNPIVKVHYTDLEQNEEDIDDRDKMPNKSLMNDDDNEDEEDHLIINEDIDNYISLVTNPTNDSKTTAEDEDDQLMNEILIEKQPIDLTTTQNNSVPLDLTMSSIIFKTPAFVEEVIYEAHEIYDTNENMANVSRNDSLPQSITPKTNLSDEEPFQGFENETNVVENWKPFFVQTHGNAASYDGNNEENWDDDDADEEKVNDILPLNEIGSNLGYIRPQFPFEPKTQLYGASEINASITSHSPIKYDVHLIDIPPIIRYRDLIGKIKIPTGYLDPRLILHQNPVITSPTLSVDRRSVHVDPRLRLKQQKQQEQQQQSQRNPNPFSHDPTGILKSSEWYQHLNMADKLALNDRLTFAAFELMQYRKQLNMNNDHQEKKTIDLNVILSNPMFYQLYLDFNISVDEYGQFIRVPGNIPGQNIIHTHHDCHFFEMNYQLHSNNAAMDLNIQSGNCHSNGNKMNYKQQ